MQFWQNRRPLILIAALLVAFSNAPALAAPYLVMDVDSGRVLEQQDAFKRWYPASLSKLMTAYVVFRAVEAGQVRLSSPVRISKNAAEEPPSKMGFPPGAVLTLDNALKIIMVKSANDVTTAIAETIAGSEAGFAARMNAEAQRLGMTDSHFVNAHGLPTSRQYTTARDLALLVRALRTEFRQYSGYFSIEGLRFGAKVLENHNMLIGRFEGADGMKTGFICAAGFNLIATATRGRRSLAAIVLGAFSPVERAEKAAELLERGFDRWGVMAPTLASLRPSSSSPDRHVATDLRSQICTAEAYERRAKLRDDEGHYIFTSPHVQPMTREPRLVTVGLERVETPPRYADVPIPTPRPDYPPRTLSAGQGG